MNEEASDKVLEVEQKYNEIRRPVYNKRNDIIHNIPDFWLTAVCLLFFFLNCGNILQLCKRTIHLLRMAAVL